MKTLLGTPRKPVQLSDVPPGEYLHFGVERALIAILDSVPPNTTYDRLEMDFNTDGASLDDSGNNQIWPIQCRIANISNSSMEVIGVYRGDKKPASAMKFFEPFVDEINKIIDEGGITYRESKYPLVLRAFIADAPARAFSLNHMGHNSTNPCSKCLVSGEIVGRRMSYREINNTPRTDRDYVSNIDDDHQHPGQSPLSLLPMGLVSQVPFEPMHLVYLGVTKRLMSAWIDGKFTIDSKLCSQDILRISARLEYLKDWYPCEFARPPRALNKYARYKATEFRQFLLYTGPVVLHGVLSDALYQHFLLLSSSMRVLVSANPTQHQLLYARLALKLFVEQSGNFYGYSFISYNIHGLLHLVDDVMCLGPADEYSAFPYENAMKKFRQYVRKPHLSLQQISNRMAENAALIGCKRKDDYIPISVAFDRHFSGPLPRDVIAEDVIQYRRFNNKNITLSSKKRNRCCLMRDFTICFVKNIIFYQNTNYLVVRKFGAVQQFFDVGISSSKIGFFKCTELHNENTLVMCTDILAKCYVMPLWSSRHLDENGREAITPATFIVAAMHCVTHY